MTKNKAIAKSTHIYILLDRSGSMSSIASDVVGGLNKYISDQQKNGPDAKVTFVQFDSQNPQEVILAGAPISEVVQLDDSTFIPRGGTPLLDATGLLIGRARVEAAAREVTGLPKQQILFVSITDGDENSSSEYSLKQIKKLYKECEAAGWTFVFISAALDAYGDAQRIGVKQGNIQAFDKSAHGTHLAFASLSAKTTDFRNNVRNLRVDLNDEFFGSDKPAEEDRNA
ncbi:MAG: VWA domain-containing protein [Actinomycetota bacterium]|nr:VWA domain-containing protein [Actinomycetota bacterium]